MTHSPITASVGAINKKIVETFPDAEVVMKGISETVRKRVSENTIVFFPVETGDVNLAIISPDDRWAISGYHRINNFTMSEVPKSTYGRGKQTIASVFNMSMFIFVDAEKMSRDLTSIMFSISAAINLVTYRMRDFETVSVLPTGGSVNSSEVLSQEYRLESSPFKLSWKMFRLNYNVTTQHDPNCFLICK